MHFFENLFNGKGLFNENSVVGLSGLRKKTDYIKITIPENYKTTFIPKYQSNYLLY